jgi:hypothetical protein
LWPDQEADGSVDTRTPSKQELRDEMGRLEKVYAGDFFKKKNLLLNPLNLACEKVRT